MSHSLRNAPHIDLATLARNSIDSPLSFGRRLPHIVGPTQFSAPGHHTLYLIPSLATDTWRFPS